MGEDWQMKAERQQNKSTAPRFRATSRRPDLPCRPKPCGGQPRATGIGRIGSFRTTAARAWVHAYLHRVEGDLANAGYWYRRAGRAEAKGPLEAEWAEIAAALLA
jgi:hypothetical protein